VYGYPNPFNAELESLTLKYFVPNNKTISSLKASIYDISGDLVYEFPEQTNLDGGYAYYFNWDGKNQNGNLCARGIYIVVFKSNLDIVKTKVILYKK